MFDALGDAGTRGGLTQQLAALSDTGVWHAQSHPLREFLHRADRRPPTVEHDDIGSRGLVPIDVPTRGVFSKAVLRDSEGRLWMFKDLDSQAMQSLAPDSPFAPRRSAAAASLASAIRLRTPPIQLVQMNGQEGTLQPWRENVTTLNHMLRDRPGELAEMLRSPGFQRFVADVGVFDYLALQEDAKSDRFLLPADVSCSDMDWSFVEVTDNDITFATDRVRPLPREVTRAMAATVARLRDDPTALIGRLRPLLSRAEVRGVIDRIDTLDAAIREGRVGVLD